MDIQAFLELDKALLSSFNGSNSLFVDQWMLTLTSGYTWIPLYVSLLYLVVKNNETMAQILLVIGGVSVCLLLSDGVADFVAKPLVARLRPCADPTLKLSLATQPGLRCSEYGFFSAHAANTFALTVFFCLLVKSRVLGTALVLWSLANCYTRVYLGLHYPSDIAAGLVWGAVVGTSVYFVCRKIHRRLSAGNNFISTQYTRSGYSFDDIDVVMLVLAATLAYTVIRAAFIY